MQEEQKGELMSQKSMDKLNEAMEKLRIKSEKELIQKIYD